MHCRKNSIRILLILTNPIDSDPEELCPETNIERLFLINHAEPSRKGQNSEGSENSNHSYTPTRHDDILLDVALSLQ